MFFVHLKITNHFTKTNIMRKFVLSTMLMACLIVFHTATAQTKIGYISFNDLLSTMPESKKIGRAHV